MSDYEGLEYEARVDAAMDDVLGRDGWCGVAGAGAPLIRRCATCAASACATGARWSIPTGPSNARIAPGWTWTATTASWRSPPPRACPTSWPTRPASVRERPSARSPGDEWRPLLEQLEAVA